MSGQRCVSGTVEDIAQRAKGEGIRPPAITVIGPVVDLHLQLDSQAPRPLSGKTVVLVRAEEREYPDVERMREVGARVLDVPGIRCVARPVRDEVAAMFESIEDSHAVVFTSALGARFFGETWSQLETRSTPLFVAASRAFLGAMRRHGMAASFAPRITGAGRVLEALQENEIEPGTVIWLPRSAAADNELPDALNAAGYDARPVDLYETLPVPLPADVRSMLADGRVDALMFLSGTCVSSVVSAVGDLPTGGTMLIAAIGPKTAAVATQEGITCDLVPGEPTILNLVDDVIRALSRDCAT